MATKPKKITPAQQAFNERAIIKAAELSIGGTLSAERRGKLLTNFRKKGYDGALKEINIYRKNGGLAPLSPNGKLNNAADVRNLVPLPEQVAYQVGKKQELPAFDEAGQKTAIEGEVTPFFNTETEEQGRVYGQNREALAADRARTIQNQQNTQIGIDETVGTEKRGLNTSIVQRNIGNTSPAYQKLQERLQKLQTQRQTETNQGNEYAIGGIDRSIANNETGFTDFQTKRRREFQTKIASELEQRRNAALGVNDTTKTTTY